ncbi:hypothetical protein S483_004017 [Salmonella enterica subsp. salamae]|nr:hypothetical protein [Salmonella enterica subsp. enterica]EEJ7236005.1 hypothetical protein [Salmonella enterica subsp. salamae]EGZ4336229.1 hypothetical protein [Salmonella enterica subsp. enterica serovar Texas]
MCNTQCYGLSREGSLFKQIMLMTHCGYVADRIIRLRRHPAAYRPMALTLTGPY